MITTCLISNFNYGEFVSDAIEGALRQTAPFDEIVVVDDGSTDGSAQLLRSRYGKHRLVQLVLKDHLGQLSCINEGLSNCSGDVVFFLDADDIYEPDYVERAVGVYERYPACDFLFCGRRNFGKRNDIVFPYPNDVDFGYSVLATAIRRQWIGAPTSCLSIRKRILDKILPLPFADEWLVRADDCLIFGASIAGARKRYLAEPLVQYRVHDRNHYHNRTIDQSTTYRRRMAINRLFEHFERKLCYNPFRLAESYHREFCTIGAPTLSQLLMYVGIGANARISLARRMVCTGAMLYHYWRAAMKGDRRAATVVGESHSAEVADTLPFTVPLPAIASTQLQSEATGIQTRRAA